MTGYSKDCIWDVALSCLGSKLWPMPVRLQSRRKLPKKDSSKPAAVLHVLFSGPWYTEKNPSGDQNDEQMQSANLARATSKQLS